MLASIRPDSWNFPLLLHVFGAMVLVGAVAAGVVAEFVSTRGEEAALLRRLAFRIFLLGALPAYIVMRVGAQWLYSKEFPDSSNDPTWIGIGFPIADAGGLVLLISIVLAGIASWNSKRRLGTAAGVLAAITLVGWLVAIWAMGAKP
ncbi:MAG: hypothetical protein ABI927_01555 [Gaiellaceae bacterium]